MKKILCLLLLVGQTLLIGCESAKPKIELRQGQANTIEGTGPSDTKK